MNPEPENFDQLQKLLALKRHESPPPGYFNGFSRKVTARIQSNQKRRWQGPAALFLGDTTWLTEVWDEIRANPLLAGGLSTAVCTVLILGFIASGKNEPPSGSPRLAGDQTPLRGVSAPAPTPSLAQSQPLSSTNPVTSGALPNSLDSLFNQAPLHSAPAKAGFGN